MARGTLNDGILLHSFTEIVSPVHGLSMDRAYYLSKSILFFKVSLSRAYYLNGGILDIHGQEGI